MRPRLLALKSAVPPYAIAQTDVAEHAQNLFSKVRDMARLYPVFANTGIDRRYSCVPVEWYLEDHGWKDRTELYIENAVDLLETVARGLLDEAGLKPNEIDSIVVVSTTGVATPRAASRRDRSVPGRSTTRSARTRSARRRPSETASSRAPAAC